VKTHPGTTELFGETGGERSDLVVGERGHPDAPRAGRARGGHDEPPQCVRLSGARGRLQQQVGRAAGRANRPCERVQQRLLGLGGHGGVAGGRRRVVLGGDDHVG